MTYLNESGDDMPGEESKTSNIDRLLRRDDSPVSDEDLRRFIASFSIRDEPPRDVEQMATALAATARASAPRAERRASRRLAVLVGAGALVIALGGVAMASDESVPGDTLYGLDRALESVGIGDGGVEERILEFDALMGYGEEQQAFELLADSIEESDGADLEKAMQHLEMAATRSSPSAESALERVAALHALIAQFKDLDDGITDDRDLGEEIASIARGENDESPGNSGNAPGQQDEQSPGNSENAPGQQLDPVTEPEDSPGNSGNAPGQQDEQTPGNSENAPGRQGENDSPSS
jgi:hypothetical protein